jgi:hypothetical protein
MNLIWIIILVAVFGLVYSVSVEAIGNALGLSANRRLISACVAGLSALGLWVYFGADQEGTRRHGEGGLDFILLPYVALAIALVILILLALLLRLVWRSRESASPQCSATLKSERSIDSP